MALLLPLPALADIDQYVDEGAGFILLTVRCKVDSVNWCNCAIASPEVVPDFDDIFMCWNVEGDKIIFRNSRYRIEKRVDEIKSRINPDNGKSKPDELPWERKNS